jgi:hypothetical protein
LAAFMTHPPFNPTHEVSFDLLQGTIFAGDSTRVMVPAEALLTLCKSAGNEAARDFGHLLGGEVGRRALERLGIRPEQASVAAIVEHFGGDLALLGLGSLSVEQWGKAAVLRISDSPLGAGGDGVLAAVLEGALQRGMSRQAQLVVLERSDGSVRFLVVNPKAAEKVRTWLAEGVTWGEVLARLNTQ